ncbi:MAG: pirin-like C-terminal cupin domain-containing protein, partial [Ilumatobacteraceae bacterium]
RPDSDMAIWHLRLEGDGTWTMPAAAGPDTVRVVYVFDGGAVALGDERVDMGSGALVRCDTDVDLTAGADGAEVLVLQGRPIGEPVTQYGPFVMNDRAGIEAAFREYRETRFGGWPWPSDEPVHGPSSERFARRPDGVVESPVTTRTAAG